MENNNKSLFWYGFFANVKKAFGKLFIFFGITTGLIDLALFQSGFFVLSIISVVVGFVLLAKGHSSRFDYQRESGYIVHSGD